MERRMLLAVVLSFIAITAYSIIMEKARPKPEKGDEQPSTEETTAGTNTPPTEGTPPGTTPVQPNGGEEATPGPGPGPAPAPAPAEEEHPHAELETEDVHGSRPSST